MDTAREIGLELLAEAAGTLLERGATHGPVRPNLDRTGVVWGALLGLEVTGADVAVLLAMLKVAGPARATRRTAITGSTRSATSRWPAVWCWSRITRFRLFRHCRLTRSGV